MAIACNSHCGNSHFGNAHCCNGHCGYAAVVAKKQQDEVLSALENLCAELEKNLVAAQAIRERAAVMREGRAQGLSWREIVESGEPPLIPELVSDKLDRLFRAGSRLRRAEAAALHEEGMSMDAIAELFGVTRQRVSALLKPLRQAEAKTAI